jgi:hypothetical protein
LISATEEVLIFDESGFLKKGNDSIGVSQQYCGNVGKVENCQVGVYAAYASPHGYGFPESRLFIPEKWFVQIGSGDGSLRGEEVSRMATPYADMHAGSFFPLAHENPVGEKKHQLLRCRSLGCSSAPCCP